MARCHFVLFPEIRGLCLFCLLQLFFLAVQTEALFVHQGNLVGELIPLLEKFFVICA